MNWFLVCHVFVFLQGISATKFTRDSKHVLDEIQDNDSILSGHFFQDIFLEHSEPEVLQFGHVFENPKDWEQRFEENDFSKNRHRGKVKWGNKDGGYGEHYWDINH